MIPLIVVAQSIEQPTQSQTPLENQVEALAISASDVRWEFVRQVYPNLTMSLGAFRHMPSEEQMAFVKKAYYLQSLKLASLLIRGDRDLAAIFNGLAADGDLESIALDFEKTYHKKYHVWPAMIPVDVDALTSRMLSQRTIR